MFNSIIIALGLILNWTENATVTCGTPAGDVTFTENHGGGGDRVTIAMASIKPYAASGPANVKTINGLAIASAKTYDGLATGSIKSINGLS